MCEFFSFITKGDGQPMYFDEAQRKAIYKNKFPYENPDSHTSIAHFYKYFGKEEDKLNKYEYNPYSKKLKADHLGAIDDSTKVHKYFNSFNFLEIIRATKIKDLDVSGCDLKGVKLPAKIGGSLYVSGCDLKGVELPAKIGGSLYVSGCDLKGVKLPAKIGRSLYMSGCDLKGVELPAKISGSLDVSGCDLKGVKLLTKIGESLDMSGCDLKGVELPAKIGRSLYVSGCDLKGVKLPASIDIVK